MSALPLPGWPDGIPQPEVEGWETEAVAWLLAPLQTRLVAAEHVRDALTGRRWVPRCSRNRLTRAPGWVTNTGSAGRYDPTARMIPTHNPQRARYDRNAVHAALDEGCICRVGFVVDGAPVVLPYLYARVRAT